MTATIYRAETNSCEYFISVFIIKNQIMYASHMNFYVHNSGTKGVVPVHNLAIFYVISSQNLLDAEYGNFDIWHSEKWCRCKLDNQNLNLQASHSPWWVTGPFLNTHSYSTCSRAITPVRPGSPATVPLCWYGAVTYTLAIYTPLQMQIIVLLFMQNINLGTCLLLRKVPSFKTSASSSAVSDYINSIDVVNAPRLRIIGFVYKRWANFYCF